MVRGMAAVSLLTTRLLAGCITRSGLSGRRRVRQVHTWPLIGPDSWARAGEELGVNCQELFQGPR